MRRIISIALMLAAAVAVAIPVASATTKGVRLSLVAYSTPREAYNALIPAFQKTPAGDGVDFSFEAIGLKQTAEQAFDCLRAGGTATIIGMIPVGQKIELDGPSFLREKKVQGCSMGSNRFKVDMPRYVELYRQGRLKLDEMITRRGRLEDVNEAFRAMKAGEVSRTVLMLG